MRNCYDILSAQIKKIDVYATYIEDIALKIQLTPYNTQYSIVRSS